MARADTQAARQASARPTRRGDSNSDFMGISWGGWLEAPTVAAAAWRRRSAGVERAWNAPLRKVRSRKDPPMTSLPLPAALRSFIAWCRRQAKFHETRMALHGL